MREALLKPDKLNLDTNLRDSLSSENNKLPDLEPRSSSKQEKILSGPPKRSAPCSHFGWLRRIFSPAKPTTILNPVPFNTCGTKMYQKGRFTEALKFYDRAIELSPNNATYHTNRALALSRLGRIGEAVSQSEKAINLDPNLAMPRQNLALFLLRLGQVDNARKHEPSGYYEYKLIQVENHLNKCTNARSRDDWTTVLKEANAAMVSVAD